jgi:ribosome biogenesis GTPase
LNDGGNLINSPGLAIFGLAGLSEQRLAYSYREFQPFINNCQFNDCRHLHNKGCPVRVAEKKDGISISRYQRFLKLRAKMPVAYV